MVLDQTTCFLQASNISFDAATLELWGPLLNSGKLVLYPHRLVDLLKINDVIRKEKVTALWLTAGLFSQWSEMARNLPSLEWILAGGDVLNASAINKVKDSLTSAQIVNGYGPTEGTTFTCCFNFSKHSIQKDLVPIGSAIQNTQVYVLDAQMKLCPKGAAGELYIGGSGLGRGYLNQPALTKERFIKNPFVDNAKSRLYRTGDLVRCLPDGDLAFIGRVDDQVKIRGFRIELGEIEHRLSKIPEVQSSIVVAIEEAGDKRLIAYVVYADSTGYTEKDLKEILSADLPEYMVPSAIVLLDALPLTANGKIDKKALPAPDGSDQLEEYVAPRSETEKKLTEIWSTLLSIPAEQIGVTANFFDLGGHSLLAVRLAAEIASVFDVELTVIDIFEGELIEELATIVDLMVSRQKNDENKENQVAIEW